MGRAKFIEQAIRGPRARGLRSIEPGAGKPSFRRGDGDASGVAELTEAVFTRNGLFNGGEEPPCRDAVGTNDDGTVNIGDPIALLVRLFLGSSPLPAPGPDPCGKDRTENDLPACQSQSCGEA